LLAHHPGRLAQHKSFLLEVVLPGWRKAPPKELEKNVCKKMMDCMYMDREQTIYVDSRVDKGG
jgi:hypothetical protein